MTDELQQDGGYTIESDDVIEDVPVTEDPTPEVDEGSDSAPDDTAKARAVKFDEEQQKVLDKAIGDKVFKLREKERENERLLKELEELKQKLPQKTRPDVPAMPDPFALTDEQLRVQMAARDKALREAAEYDAHQRLIAEQQEQVRARQAAEQAEAKRQQVETYLQKATKLGVKKEELQEAGNTVHSFGIREELVDMILHDEQGPLITKYLASNLTELDALTRMPIAQAAVRIAVDIKQKASALKPKVNSAPDPLDRPTPSGSAPKERGPKGATFE